jgi:gas vesicle protein
MIAEAARLFNTTAGARTMLPAPTARDNIYETAVRLRNAWAASPEDRGGPLKTALFRALAVIAVAIALTAPAAGCGDREPPQTVFDRIDYFVYRLDTGVSKLSDTVDSLATDIEQGVELTRDVLEDARNAIEADARKVRDQLDAAVEQIREAASSKSGSEYKKFLEIQEEILDNATTLVETVADVTAEISSAIEAVRTGKAPDTSALSSSLEEWSNNFRQVRQRTQELIDQAKNLR